MNRLMKMREEQLLQHEQTLLSKEEELRKVWEERSMQLHSEIDADLRAKWEIKAELEIRRRVEMELQARFQHEVQQHVEFEVQRRIQELDLIPRTRSVSPTLLNSSGSSGASSGISFTNPLSQRLATPHKYCNNIPDSPADITMASPSVNGTPGHQQTSIFTQEPLSNMLPRNMTNSTLRGEGNTRRPYRKLVLPSHTTHTHIKNTPTDQLR